MTAPELRWSLEDWAAELDALIRSVHDRAAELEARFRVERDARAQRLASFFRGHEGALRALRTQTAQARALTLSR